MAGRPTKYKEDMAEKVYKFKLDGKSDIYLCDFFSISTGTLDNWKHEHEEFLSCYKKGMADCDAERNSLVKNALLRRALGTSISEHTIETLPNGDEKKKTVKKDVAPDTGACMAWLHNKAQDEFKPRKQVDDSLNGKDETVESLNFSFNVNDAVSEVKVTRGTK